VSWRQTQVLWRKIMGWKLYFSQEPNNPLTDGWVSHLAHENLGRALKVLCGLIVWVWYIDVLFHRYPIVQETELLCFLLKPFLQMGSEPQPLHWLNFSVFTTENEEWLHRSMITRNQPNFNVGVSAWFSLHWWSPHCVSLSPHRENQLVMKVRGWWGLHMPEL
jgi:hemolysin-activating ACP:hemolysin acyltransferase